MDLNDIQIRAVQRGYLIFAIDQGRTPAGAAGEGYCLGLCANWIALAYHGKNFPIKSDMSCGAPPPEAVAAQNRALAGGGRGPHWTNSWALAVEPFGCRVSQALFAHEWQPPRAEFLWSTLSRAYGCYGVAMFPLRGASGHAIALRHGRDNRYHLFDPNHFHIAVRGVDAFKAFVDGYLEAAGYRKEFDRTGIIGITPWINHEH